MQHEKKKRKLQQRALEINAPDLDMEEDHSHLWSERHEHGMSSMQSSSKLGKARAMEYRHVDAVEQELFRSTDMLHSLSEEELADEVLVDCRRERHQATNTALSVEKSAERPITMPSDDEAMNKEAIVYKPAPDSDWVKSKEMTRSVQEPVKDYAALASFSSRMPGSSSSSSSSSSESDGKSLKRFREISPPSPTPTDVTAEVQKKKKKEEG